MKNCFGKPPWPMKANPDPLNKTDQKALIYVKGRKLKMASEAQ